MYKMRHSKKQTISNISTVIDELKKNIESCYCMMVKKHMNPFEKMKLTFESVESYLPTCIILTKRNWSRYRIISFLLATKILNIEPLLKREQEMLRSAVFHVESVKSGVN